MDIFNIPQPQISPSRQEAINLAEKNRVILDTLKKGYMDSFNHFWNNPNATPQNMCNEYGTGAKDIFIKSKTTVDFIKFLDPNWVAPVSPKPITINNDGSVTIHE